MRSFLTILTVAFWAVGLQATPSLAADTQAHELDQANRRAELIGWEGVGRLDIGRASTCTGALIAPDMVLTAAHCVLDKKNQPYEASSIVFRAGLRNGEYVAASRGIDLAVQSGFDNRGRLTSANIRNDLAIVRLANPIPRALAAPFPVHRVAVPKGDLMVASYGRGRNAAPSIQRHCNILKFSRKIYEFDCNITFGSSGAPVFAYDGGRRAILSVVSGMATGPRGKIGLGMSLQDKVVALRRQLANGAKAANFKPAEVKRITVGSDTKTGNAKFLRP